MTRLPSADWQPPACGVCWGDTRYEDGAYDCEDCGLSYNADDMSAEFTDPDAQPCGNPCDNPRHSSGSFGPYDCNPCALPKGHASDHWTGCVPILKGES